jgi:biopolymer transport protein TolQ
VNSFAASENGLMWLVGLFRDANLPVQIVMVLLLLASVWTWAIIATHWAKMRRINRDNDRFERDFWKSDDIDSFYEARGRGDLPSAKILAAGIAEWRRSTTGRSLDRDGTRDRLAVAMHSAVAAETDRLASKLNILATVGSTAPFVGLFGTVLGIMFSFSRIAQEKNSSLDVVAPGIAEALFATALGLVAAIPAVLAYNKLSGDIGRYGNRLEAFSGEFGAILSRQLEEKH